MIASLRKRLRYPLAWTSAVQLTKTVMAAVIAWVLAVPISYFFDEMPARALSGRPLSGYRRKGFWQAVSTFKQKKDLLSKRETLELVRAYEKIDEERVRDSIFAAVKALGESGHAKLLTSRRKR